MILLPPSAHALRPVRIRNNEAIHYTATTFPNNPLTGCNLMLHRCKAFGYLSEKQGDLWIDILNAEGDILTEIGVSASGFQYLRRKLQFKKESI